MTQSVTITSPSNGSTVKGTVTVAVNAVEVGQVNLLVDDKYIEADGSSPFSFTLDTTKLTDGAHKITAQSGNHAVSASVTITVANLAPSPTPTPSPTPPPTPPVPVGARIFGDEFDGPAGPPSTIWTSRTGRAGNGLAYWDAARAKLDGNGNLVVTAEEVSGVWHTAMLMGKKVLSGQRYIEASAKLPEIPGNWSAPNWEWDPAGKGLEVDVNEQLGDQPGEYHFTLHNWDAGKQSGRAIQTGANLAEWHTYGCALYHDHADCYFDNKLMATIKASEISYADLAAHQVCENIDLNIGGWGGAVSGVGPFEMLVRSYHVDVLA